MVKKQMSKKIKALILAGSVIAGGVVGANLFPKEIINPINTELQNKVTTLTSDALEITLNIDTLKNEVELLKINAETNAGKIDDKIEQINTLQDQVDRDALVIADYKVVEAELAAEQTVVESTYMLDDVFLNQEGERTLSDREINLLDTEVKFDGETYDAEEILSFKFTVSTTGEDFKGVPHFTIDSEDLVYEYVLDNGLDVSAISEDDTLKIVLLGKEIEISDWDNNEITITSGEVYDFEAGETKVIDDITYRLVAVGDTEAQFIIGGQTVVLEEEEKETVNGVQIYLDKVVVFNDDSGYAKIKVGDVIEETIKDGDEYADNSPFEYTIEPGKIGVKLVEQFVNLDDDYVALNAGDTISLPNNYKTITYGGIVEQDTEGYAFDVYTKNSVDYLRVKGNFISGIEDYDKIYVGNTGIYDSDLELIGQSIDLADTDSTLKVLPSTVKIGAVKIAYDVTDVKVSGDSIANEDDDVTTDYGITIKNPEDSIEDQKLRIVVPEEKTEAIVTVV